MKEVVIHAGFAKTGTTSIQLLCRASAGVLAEQGVLYPDLPAPPDDARAQPNHIAALAAFAPQLPRRIRAHRMWGRRLMANLFADFRTGPFQRLVISHESLGALNRIDGRIVRRLAEGCALRYVAYVRRHDEWIESRIEQQMRSSRVITRSPAKSPLTDYERARPLPILEQVRAELPEADIRVRSFDKVKKSGLIEDFLETAGITLTDELAARIAAQPRSNIARQSKMFALFAIYLGAHDPGLEVDMRRAIRVRERQKAPLPAMADSFQVVPHALLEHARRAYNDEVPALRRDFGFNGEPAAEKPDAGRRTRFTRAEFDTIVDYLAPAVAEPRLAQMRAAFGVADPLFD